VPQFSEKAKRKNIQVEMTEKKNVTPLNPRYIENKSMLR